MIENLRKYTGLIIVLFVLVIIGFIFMDTSTMRASQGGSPYLKVGGRTYDSAEFQKTGKAGFELTQSLMQSGDFQFYGFIIALTGQADSQEQAEENFFVNRLLLRDAKEEFGVHPGEDEIDGFIKKMRIFAGDDGSFSQEKYRNFIERGIGRLGLMEEDVRRLASDVIAQKKLSEILGSGLTTPTEIVEKQNALDQQKIAVEVAMLEMAPVKEKIKVTEDEVKSYWETIRDAFRTPEKRSFTYFIAKPELGEEPAALEPLAEDASDEEKAAFEEKNTARTAEIEDAKRVAQLDLDKKVDNFLLRLEDQEDSAFEESAKKEGWELVTSEPFAVDSPPEELAQPLRSSSAQGTAADELFKMVITDDPISKISPAIAVGENEWVLAHYEKTVDSRVKTFEEAKEDAEKRLIEEKSSAALKKAGEEAAEAIKAAMEDGKSFAAAAEAAGIEAPVEEVSDVTANYQGDTEKVPGNLFEAVKYTDADTLEGPVLEAERAFLIYVESREVIDTPEAASSIESQVSQAAEANKIAAFMAWLNSRMEAANVQPLYQVAE